MRWVRGLSGCLGWTLTLAVAAAVIVGAATWRGRLIWVFDPASSAVVVRHGVVLLAWPDGSEIDRLVNRVAGLPALPGGPTGTNVLLDYRQRLYDNSVWELTSEAMRYEPEPLVHAGFPWVWLGGRHSTGTSNVSGFALPLWIPGAAFGVGAGLMWWPRARRWWRGRAGVGRCASCGYDRRGLGAAAKCPECGDQPKSDQPRSAA